ncbi:MAG: ABC transporter ATP-binding protein [Acidiferrobacterales bacterium]|jgi:ABC-2 type transport system ATP-binding protein|nr:ABC transporter ATP-binding protein [Acidiferrobacterales bacterium]
MSGLAVDIHHLSVRFGDFYAVNDISFSVNAGEVFGFLGANGAGKTTTIRVLCGLLRPSAGEGSVAGVNLDAGEMAIKARVGYMSQKFTLYNDLTVEENLSFIAGLRKINPQEYATRRDSILEFIEFDRPLTSLVRDLPGGIKQQVSLAAAILHDPDIVFLDEPTAGVTPAARVRFWALIRQLADRGKTLFVTTHYMDEAEQCDRIALMRAGQIIALDTPAALKRHVFPDELLELEPIKQFRYADVEKVRRHPDVVFFEPYGMRYHVALSETPGAEKLRKELAASYRIRTITPTLEDVFIRSVEGEER